MDFGDPSTWSNSTMVDSRVACAECQSLTHEAADCPQRKHRETNMANRAKHLQGKVDKLALEGLHSRLHPAVTPSSYQRAAYNAVDNIWLSTTEQMQLPSSSLRPTTLSDSSDEKLCLANVVEQYRLELLRQAVPNNENIHL